MNSNDMLKNFYQPKARYTSFRRLESLKQKSEQLEPLDYKKALLAKLKTQYQVLASQQVHLQKHHRLLPETTDFTPLLKNEATKKYLEKKNKDKECEVRSYLKQLEEEEEVKYISIQSRELAAQFKTFNRDKAITNAQANRGKTGMHIFKQKAVDVPLAQPKLSEAELFVCNNKDLLRKFYPIFREAFANNSQQIVEVLIEDILADEVGSLDSEPERDRKQEANSGSSYRFRGEIYQRQQKL